VKKFWGLDLLVRFGSSQNEQSDSTTARNQMNVSTDYTSFSIPFFFEKSIEVTAVHQSLGGIGYFGTKRPLNF
jgi:hypothetical protein